MEANNNDYVNKCGAAQIVLVALFIEKAHYFTIDRIFTRTISIDNHI